ncbi:hypothetical protein UO65_4789 [Actinokineospora spheciospongiae]|uniref:DUF402 domain-containing protein n=1 Tax=Actinokineospora spheciospongiae TaxID=909613 RepID=W7J1E6_9PSEU|nr:DUF402 domain-containing protein [Actinokineospora spheciospongiae]EWC59929.1 hypothetical protein UO65_4789 [Actinokineospora spheciospongiae]PWW52226.1 hypothetical protein DFQ13_11818 [Actinokineospora spheciospongiae]
MARTRPVPVPAARRDDRQHEVHPPKVELFDPAARTNTDPKGFVRAVDAYRETPEGLFMARPVDGHPRIAYFQSLLLPELGLRVSKWRPRPGVDLGHDFYLDVVDISVDDRSAWRTVDLYLDVLVRTGRDVRVEDTDELLAAFRTGLLDSSTVQRAMERTYRAVDGIAHSSYDVDAWLVTLGITPPWIDRTR